MTALQAPTDLPSNLHIHPLSARGFYSYYHTGWPSQMRLYSSKKHLRSSLSFWKEEPDIQQVTMWSFWYLIDQYDTSAPAILHAASLILPLILFYFFFSFSCYVCLVLALWVRIAHFACAYSPWRDFFSQGSHPNQKILGDVHAFSQGAPLYSYIGFPCLGLRYNQKSEAFQLNTLIVQSLARPSNLCTIIMY